jgi:hypothetical protein
MYKTILPAAASETQITETQQAFYSGAYAVLMDVLHRLGDDDVSEVEGVAALEQLRAECENYIRTTIAEKTKAEGAGGPRFTNDDMEDIQTVLGDLGRRISGKLPGGWGFNLLLFSFGEGGHLFYISNATSETMVEAMREFIRRQEH